MFHFQFPVRYQGALQCAALVGFTREISFEGQAAIWLEHLAQSSGACDAYTFPIVETTLDFRPLLTAVVEDRVRGRDPSGIARAFHKGVARGLCDAVKILCEGHTTEIVVLIRWRLPDQSAARGNKIATRQNTSSGLDQRGGSTQ
jgi:hydrogenase maturation protein HypF